MSSTSSTTSSTSKGNNPPSKPTPPAQSASGPSSDPPPPPPQRPDFFTTIRRFSDHQFSSILHSLIGVPTIVSQPSQPPKNWILDSDLPADHPDNPRPRTRRSGSDSLVDEMKRIQEEDESDRNRGSGGGDSGGMGIQRTVSSTSSTGAGNSDKRDVATMTTSPVPLPRDVSHHHHPAGGQWLGEALWRPFEALQESQLAWASPPRSPLLEEMMSLRHPRRPDHVGDHGGQRDERDSGMTELDYYDFFEKQMAAMRKAMGTPASSPPASSFFPPSMSQDAIPRRHQLGLRMESLYEETRTVREPDGSVRTKRVQVRRFPDGREERVESDDTGLLGDVGRVQGERRPELGVLKALERSRTTQ